MTTLTHKSLQGVEIDLGRVNVFIGANGAGKTNLLEAAGVPILTPPDVATLRGLAPVLEMLLPEDEEFPGLDPSCPSDGTLYGMFLSMLATHKDTPRAFAVDNFAHPLNPRTARYFTVWFVEQILNSDRQVLIATHNPLVLDGLALDDDRVRLFTVSNEVRANEARTTKVRRVPVRDLAACKRTYGEHAVSQRWIEGRLGGMPDCQGK